MATDHRSPPPAGEPRPASPTAREALALGLLFALLLAVLASPSLQRAGTLQLEQAAERALASFAVARGLNAVISTVQEAEIGFSLGVNGSLKPGQVLDPLNDLVERFSLAALAAATLLWALQLLRELLLGPLPVLVLLLLTGAGYALLGLRRWGARELGQLSLRGMRVAAVVCSFALLTPHAIEAVHQSGPVQGRYAAASADLARALDAVEALADFDGLPSRDEVEQRVGQLAGFIDRLSRDAVAVLAVFLVEVLLVPLGVFWLGLRLLARNPATA